MREEAEMARSGRAPGPGAVGWGRAARGRRRRPDGRGPGELSVQLLPHLLAAGDLPRAAVGDVLDVAPAIYAATLRPGRGGDRWADRWSQDEFGTLEAAGSLLAARLDPGGCSCRVDVLDVGGHLVPLNPAAALLDGTHDGAPGPVGRAGGDGGPGERVRVEGAVYLDPELGPGTPYGAAVALCRRRYRVGALRRYRRTLDVPADPVVLTAVPAPAAVSEDAVYVAELVLDAGPRP